MAIAIDTNAHILYLSEGGSAASGSGVPTDPGGSSPTNSTSTNVYRNGIIQTVNLIELGGSLTHDTIINFGNNDMTFLGQGSLSVGGNAKPSKLNVIGGNIEIVDDNKGIIFKDPDGIRWLMTVNKDGAFVATRV